MHKIWIIFRSEFWRRVRSKWFIIITLLAPLFIVAMMALPTVLALFAADSSESRVIVRDETGVLLPRLQTLATDAFDLQPTELSADEARTAVREGTYDGFLLIPAEARQGEGSVNYYASEGGPSLRSRLGRLIDRAVEQQRLADENAPESFLEIVNTDVPLRMIKLTEEGEEADSTGLFFIVGFAMGMFIYVTVLIYGALVMQGVIEEKASRVVEVMVSSVRPFQLLMGKVLGIGAMGLLQMAVWATMILALTFFAGTLVALFLDPSQFNLPADASQEAVLAAADIQIPSIPASLFVWFILFFLGGYLLYASLYAAIGSAVESPQDAQALSVPLTLVVIVPMFFLSYMIEAPNSTLAVLLSLFPFFSPILMIVRMAVTEVPWWQVGLSYILLLGGFVGAMWVSGRIYRVGILMYGKKPSIKDLARWFRQA